MTDSFGPRLRTFRLSLGLLTAMSATALGRSADVATTFESWGLMGTWAGNCAAPPGRDNTFYTFVRRDHGVFLDRDGAGFKDSSPISQAAIRPDGMVEYHVTFGQGRSQVIQVNTYARRPDGRIRIFFNRRIDGPVTVDNGRLMPSGEETSWREKCAPGRVVDAPKPPRS